MWRPTVLVGVGGASGWQALAWAVEEASSTGAKLLICHACPGDSPLAGAGPRVPLGLLELADPALARAVAGARTRLGGDRVTLHVQPGPPGQILLAAAQDADLVVLGAPTGHAATVHQVVTGAPGPTVVVRPVRTSRDPAFAGHVVVAVAPADPTHPDWRTGGAAHNSACLEFAFRFASTHRRPLAAVHACAHCTGDVRLDGRLARHEPAGGEPRCAAHLAGLELLAGEVEPWADKFPEVEVTRAVYAGTPLPALLRAADGAALLVLGSRGPGGATRRLLGSVSHGAVDQAGCPVAVIRGGNRAGAQPLSQIWLDGNRT